MGRLPKGLQIDATTQFKDLLVFSLGHGLELLQKQGDLIPMVITLMNGNHGITVGAAVST